MNIGGVIMATARDVAAYILERAGAMTAMKVQKLCYYSQAWSIVWREEVLFEDKIEAWAAGPVVRSLYEAHRGKFRLTSGDEVGGVAANLTADERSTVEKVLAHYGRYNAEQLSDLTHSEEPWKVARGSLPPTARGNCEIDPSLMFDYYATLARAQQV